MKKTAMLVLLCFSLLIPVCSVASMERNTDRPGSDYAHFDLSQPDPQLCQQKCQDETDCKAWTYVKPGITGSKAHCWLKSAVPDAVPNPDCTSGIALPHIVGIDIACSNGNVYTWYSNGMVSIGDSDNLAHKEAPHPYTIVSGKKPTDILGTSIKEDVLTLYKDGTYTMGTSVNLIAKMNPLPVRDGVAVLPRFELPPGRRHKDIVGISENCDGELFVWYKNGTGDDFRKHKSFSYHVPPGKQFTDIIEIGISKSGDVFTWYKDGTVSIGTKNDLDVKRSPYQYHHPYER